MTVYNLLEGLQKELADLFSGFKLASKQSNANEVNIFLQNLPAAKSEQALPKDAGNFPFIVIRYTILEDKSHEEATANITFCIGVYDADSGFQGYKDVINIQEKIRQHFLAKRVVGNRFTIIYPVKCVPYDDFSENTYPYFYGQVDTVWTMPALQIEEVYS